MKYFYLLMACLALCFVSISQVFANTSSNNVGKILISEIQTGTELSASEEFVELYSSTYSEISLDNMVLQYKSKTGENWITKAELTGEIIPHGRFLLSSSVLYESSQTMNGGMAATSGHVRLLDIDNSIIDLVAWGEEADSAEGAPAITHDKNESLKRLFDEDGYIKDTNNNLEDFFVSTTPTPSFSELQTEVAEPELDQQPDNQEEVENPEETQEDNEQIAENTPVQTVPEGTEIPKNNVSSAEIVITEVLPDPVSPFVDKEHEFVELYNPNEFSVQLAGYVLESGTDWRYSYTLGSYLLKPNEYLAVFANESGLTLTNSGTGVRISGGAGIVSEISYPKSVAGKSYALQNNEWVWAIPSPNEENPIQISEGTDGEVAAQTTEDTSDSESSSALSKQSIDFVGDEMAAATDEESSKNTFKDFESETTINSWVLAGVGSLAVLYGCYEYRNDIALRVQQLRRYYRTRRENRANP